MNLTEKTKSSKCVFDGTLLKVYKDEIICPNDNESTREYIKHCPAAAILPITENGNVILEKQFRYPLHQILIEVPAGKSDLHEKPFDTAKRELEEETGFKAEKLVPLGTMLPAAAYCDEVIYLYVAKELKEGQMKRDFDEFMELMTVPLEEFYKMCADGTINDAKTLAIALRYKLNEKAL